MSDLVPNPDLAEYSKTIEEATRHIIGMLNGQEWPELTTRITSDRASLRVMGLRGLCLIEGDRLILIFTHKYSVMGRIEVVIDSTGFPACTAHLPKRPEDLIWLFEDPSPLNIAWTSEPVRLEEVLAHENKDGLVVVRECLLELQTFLT